MKLIKSRAATYISLTVLLLSFVSIILALILSSGRQPLFESMNPHKVSINGKYSIDGGEWMDTLPDEMLHTRFKNVTVKGYLSKEVNNNEQLVIFSENINYKLECNGILIENNKENSISPGNDIVDVPVSKFSKGDSANAEIKLTMDYPYTMFSNADLSDFFRMYITDSSGVYDLLIEARLPIILFCLTICFFGLFFRDIAHVDHSIENVLLTCN